jgi:hypothetical protein
VKAVGKAEAIRGSRDAADANDGAIAGARDDDAVESANIGGTPSDCGDAPPEYDSEAASDSEPANESDLHSGSEYDPSGSGSESSCSDGGDDNGDSDSDSDGGIDWAVTSTQPAIRRSSRVSSAQSAHVSATQGPAAPEEAETVGDSAVQLPDEAEQDRAKVELYAAEIVATCGVDPFFAYSAAMDSFAADPVTFRSMVTGMKVGQTVLASKPRQIEAEQVDDVATSLESAKQTLEDVKRAHSAAELTLESAQEKKALLDRQLQERQVQKVQKATEKAKLKLQAAALKERRVQDRLQQVAVLELEKARIQAERTLARKACGASSTQLKLPSVDGAPEGPGQVDESMNKGGVLGLLLDSTISMSHDEDEDENDDTQDIDIDTCGRPTARHFELALTKETTPRGGDTTGVQVQATRAPTSAGMPASALGAPPIPPPLSAQRIVELFSLKRLKAVVGLAPPPIPPPLVLPSTAAPPLPPPLPAPLNQTNKAASAVTRGRVTARGKNKPRAIAVQAPCAAATAAGAAGSRATKIIRTNMKRPTPQKATAAATPKAYTLTGAHPKLVFMR